tara:strand:- start:242 stop:412 length:171 start_codon:yes stop_codon:yes gene_type:complete
MKTNKRREGLKIMALSNAASTALTNYKATKDKENEKTASLKEKYRRKSNQTKRRRR